MLENLYVQIYFQKTSALFMNQIFIVVHISSETLDSEQNKTTSHKTPQKKPKEVSQSL